ncbi:response regulator transcription factor [Paenibacillus glycanilyticus]|uniref:DNA-binding response regulator n=1 Tax=Paenibacillus glycanilyticus TaxID=126569 RepID=A0ABQ6G6S5_9BACL|nr:response regulator [Paenibacillus glycanilyticus]GLX66676.1 hypothetical protein MU1_10200 [Paenibacillus glycanilyticus]
MKAMLIDDDVPMLEYVAYLLQSLDLGLDIVASASNSDQALEDFHATLPDLAIVDIGLPGMDGLELAETFRMIKPEVRLVFLTCYEDFQYTKKAFQLEADDYLIKDELSPEQLMHSLRKAMSRYRSREELLEHYTFRQTVEHNKEVLRQSFFKQLLSPEGPSVQTLLFGESLGINWRLPYFRQGFIHLDSDSVFERYSYGDMPLIQFAVYNIAMELSGESDGITPILTEEGICFVWNVPDPDCSYQPLLAFLTSLQEKVEHYLKITVRGFYATQTVTLRQFGQVYRAWRECRDDYFYKTPQLINPIDVLNPRPAFRQATEWRWDKVRNMLSQALEEGNAAWIDMAVNQWIQQAGTEQLQPRLTKEVCGDFVRQMSLESSGVAENNFLNWLGQAVHINEAAALTKRELRNLWRQHTHAPVSVQEKDSRLQEIDQFLDAHVDRMITSQEMSEHLHLNASYFSRYFKKLAGINFTDYVNQYKINIAITMLGRQNETVENVAYTLGFSDRAYFSKVFKKYSGKSPSEYKNQITGDSEARSQNFA